MRIRALTVTVAVSLVLAACGGDDGDSTQDALRQMQDALEQAGLGTIDLDDLDLDDLEVDDPFTEGAPTEIEPPVFTLVGPADAPAGWVYDPPMCASDDELGPPQLGYYVPAEWNRTGSGYGGSGGFEGSGDHTYQLPDGGEIKIDTSTDSYWDGEVLDASAGEPWTTWDYDITEYGSSGERSERIEYEQLAPIDIGGQQVDLFYLDATRFELESQSKYKARIVYADLPAGGFGQNLRNPGSATVTITWNPERAAPDEEEIRAVLDTMRIEQCVVDLYLEYYGLIFGTTWTS